MINDPGGLRPRLKAQTDHAWRLYCALETVIPYQGSGQNSQPRIHRQRLVASTVPWHSRAAMLVTELDAEIRRLEVQLKEHISGTLRGRRGGSRQNTRHALRSVANLAEAVDDQVVLGILNKISRWTRQADAIFEPEKGLHRIPRAPGEGEMRCPYCAFPTMRWHPASGIAVCVNPECITAENTRPRWTVQYVLIDDELKFTWELCGEAA